MLNIVLYYSPRNDWAFIEEPDDSRPATPYSKMRTDYIRDGGLWEIRSDCRLISDKDAEAAPEDGENYSKEEFIGCLRFDEGGAVIIKNLLNVSYDGSSDTIDEAIQHIAEAFYRLGVEHGEANHAGDRRLAMPI